MMTSSQHQAWLFQNRWRSGNQANTNRLKQFIGYILAKPHRHTTVLPRCLRSAVGTRPPAGKQSLQARVFHPLDRKSTRLNSSHVARSYAVFCSKKKKNATK